jgi:SPP1 gp7 family putative phage head morphogenesis protein
MSLENEATSLLERQAYMSILGLTTSDLSTNTLARMAYVKMIEGGGPPTGDFIGVPSDLFSSQNYKMKYNEAIKYFVDKVPKIYENFEAITDKYISNSFWIKKLADLELTKKVKKSLEKVLNEGKTFESWKKSIDLKALGEWYLETVFRTNVNSAYSAGRYEQQMNMKSIFEYWLYDAVMDSRTSELCSELDGKMYRADNPIWNKIYPPLHYNCRSDVIALNKTDLKAMNISQKSVDSYKIQDSEIYKEFVEKSNFANNPFDINYEKLYNDKRF